MLVSQSEELEILPRDVTIETTDRPSKPGLLDLPQVLGVGPGPVLVFSFFLGRIPFHESLSLLTAVSAAKSIQSSAGVLQIKFYKLDEVGDG